MIDPIDIQLYSFFIIFGLLILFVIIATIKGKIVKFKERKEQKIINDKWTKIFVDLSNHPIEEKKKVSEVDYLSIYSVVPCDLDYSEENYDACVCRIELRIFDVNIKDKKGEIYTVENDVDEEYSGTKDELFRIHTEEEEVFTMNDIIEEKYVYNGKILEDSPFDDNYDTKWRMEEFFMSKKEAYDYFQKTLEEFINEEDSPYIKQ